MKRVLTVVGIILAISTSLIAGTMSMYVVDIDDLATGSVVAKEFILEEGSVNSFEDNIKIAPGETVEWKFSVKNGKDGVVSETAMDLDFAVDVAAAQGRDAIEPLEIIVTDEDNNVKGTETNTGKIEFSDEFPLQEDQIQEKVYDVSIHWPSNDDVDIDFAGDDFGTSVKVSVTGTQKQD